MAGSDFTHAWSPASTLLHHGLLEHAPDAWLQLLFSVLDGQDKLVLFKASRQTARLVMCHCPTFRLVLRGSREPHAIKRAEEVITGILKGFEQLTVHVSLQHGRQPFPYELSPYVHKLIIKGYSDELEDEAWLQFNRLTALKELSFENDVSECVVISLCTALEAGLIPHLYQFNDTCLSLLVALKNKPKLMQRLSSALGASVRVLHVHGAYVDNSVLTDLHRFPALHTLHLTSCISISKQFVRQLCEHPALDTVIMTSCSITSSGLNDCKCRSWQTLVFESEVLRAILVLPLQALEKVILRASNLKFHEEDAFIIQELLSLGSKLTWTPRAESSGTVILSTAQTSPRLDLLQKCMPLLRSLVSPYQPSIALHVWDHNDAPCSTSLPALWKYIPNCVKVIFIRDPGLVRSLNVWEGMPEHVTGVALRDLHGASALPCNNLHLILRTVPMHVRKLRLLSLHGRLWPAEFISLKALAPSHVELSIECVCE